MLGCAALFIAQVNAELPPTGDPALGKIFFQQSCAVCHADNLGPGNTETVRQGPSLVGVVGRPAAGSLSFNYTKSMRESGLKWDPAFLDGFLSGPQKLVPGTTMPITIANPADRANVIAYLSTLKIPDGVTLSAPAATAPGIAPVEDPGDWHHAAPGLSHHISVADLPPPYSTRSSGNGPKVVSQPTGAALAVPPGFTVRQFASGFTNPRILRVAPNGDIFLAETSANRIRVLRAPDGADAPVVNEIFTQELDRPFGIAFYPSGNDPKWVYVANNNSVVRFAYRNGDLKATGSAQIVVPKLTESGGGHSTRDVAFSLDNKRMFISVGSQSNAGEHLSKRGIDDAHAWECEHGLGAAWDAEANRADILVTDPEGQETLHPFATGIRNGVGMAVNQETGQLWTSANERDGLGDDLVPDYLTHVKEGGFYGWPWYYTGNHEDPRHAGERPDLAGQAIVPDVLLQSHSAPLEICFYAGTKGPALFPKEYWGDLFAAAHGSWNRSSRTGYKVVRARMNHGIPTGDYEDFLTGFVVDNASVWGRPVGVAVAHDGALLLSEDGNGTIWRISYTGH